MSKKKKIEIHKKLKSTEIAKIKNSRTVLNKWLFTLTTQIELNH